MTFCGFLANIAILNGDS